MLRRSAIALGLLLTSVLSQNGLRASSVDLLVERPDQSLRGHAIDLGDHWNSARLLAHFGEYRLAHQALQKRDAHEPLNPTTERFEARVLTEMGLYARADSLLALQSYTGDLSAFYTLYLQRSRLNFFAGNHARSLEFLDRIASLSSPVFEPYTDYLSLMALMKMERYEEATVVGARRLAAGIPVSLSPIFEEHLFDSYLKAEKFEKAQELINVLLARRSRGSSLAPILIREVDLLLLTGDTTRAVTRALALTKHKNTKHMSLSVAETVIASVDPSTLTSEALIKFSEIFLKSKRLGEADLLVELLRERALSDHQKDQRTVLIADLYYREKRYSKSYSLIDREFSDPPLRRTVMLLRARIYRKTGQPIRSADAYKEFARVFPYDVKAAEALQVAADLYFRSGKPKKGIATLELIVNTYPSRRAGRNATMRTADYYIGVGQVTKATKILERTLERSGRSNEELLYYLASAYAAAGKKTLSEKIWEELRELDRGSFYLNPAVAESSTQPMIESDGTIALGGDDGLLRFLKDTFNRRQTAYEAVRIMLDPLDNDDVLEPNAVYLDRGRQFLEMGFRDWAEMELRVVESKKSIPPRVWFELGVLYDDFAMHWKSVRAFQRVYYSKPREERSELDPYFKILMYPVPFPAAVFENCARYKIPPHLIYAMMREESRFDNNAVSRAGAMGLMQLMPATGAQVANELGFPSEVNENLFAPEINLTFGIWYASHLLKRAKEDPLMMMSAYNAGMGNARKWFDPRLKNDDASVIAMVDGIDYTETRNYVKRIVESARVYHTFYFSPDVRMDDSIH